MPFVYRLQKVYELRERKKKEQERRVQRARERLRQVEHAIELKKTEIRQVRQNMLTTSHLLLESHDIYLQKLNDDITKLNEERVIAQNQLDYEMQLLIKAQADLEALNKHKERSHEEWIEEEKQKELKLMDEIAGQRYFRNQEAVELDERLLEEDYTDNYAGTS